MSETDKVPVNESPQLKLTATDPVCGMTVDPATARGVAQYQGDTYCFCSPACMHRFLSEPARYSRQLPPNAGGIRTPVRSIRTYPPSPEGPGMRNDRRSVESSDFCGIRRDALSLLLQRVRREVQGRPRRNTSP